MCAVRLSKPDTARAQSQQTIVREEFNKYERLLDHFQFSKILEFSTKNWIKGGCEVAPAIKKGQCPPRNWRMT
jgi:hypothetical protein